MALRRPAVWLWQISGVCLGCCVRHCWGQWNTPPVRQNSTWLTIGGAFAGIGIGIVMLVCILMVCFDRRRHRRANIRAASAARTLQSLGGGVPGSLQVREVTIPIVVISPTGDVELAKSLSRQSVPGIELTGEGDTPIPNKGSSMVVLTHGEPAFAEADLDALEVCSRASSFAVLDRPADDSEGVTPEQCHHDPHMGRDVVLELQPCSTDGDDGERWRDVGREGRVAGSVDASSRQASPADAHARHPNDHPHGITVTVLDELEEPQADAASSILDTGHGPPEGVLDSHASNASAILSSRTGLLRPHRDEHSAAV